MAGQLALAATAPAGGTSPPTGTIVPARVNSLDCNGWSTRYAPSAPSLRMRCADPLRIYGGHATRFYDNGHYVGHDEPAVKFISSRPGSGNTMTYAVRLPKDPARAPTASGSVTHYAELSIAPSFGVAVCDPRSYPQNPCKPDSDANAGSISNPRDAGSAFGQLQFFPPGFPPLADQVSCSAAQWCAALTIDSLECTYGFAACNNHCLEPANFSYLQADGVPPGPPAPQDPGPGTWFGNARTLRMNPGDVLRVSVSDPPAGLTVKITDLTARSSGFMVASARNGFAGTSIRSCAGHPFTFHAEYSTARKRNQVPWAALEGGVFMAQEIGHGETCRSLSAREGVVVSFAGGASYRDPGIYQACGGGREGARGEGPCQRPAGPCRGAATQGRRGPVACTPRASHCEDADGYCVPRGRRAALLAGRSLTLTAPVAQCLQNQFENGDLDFDGTSYHADWPSGSARFPESFAAAGPVTTGGHSYPQIQFETDVGGAERLCDTATGRHCTAPPEGAAFYPFWTLTRACAWNFGNVIAGVTRASFGGDRQYGAPDVRRYGGTLTGPVRANPACRPG